MWIGSNTFWAMHDAEVLKKHTDMKHTVLMNYRYFITTKTTSLHKSADYRVVDAHRKA